MTTAEADWFESEVARFVTYLEDLLDAVFGEFPDVTASIGLSGLTSAIGSEHSLRTSTDTPSLATLKITYRLCPDSTSTHLAVQHSSFQLLAALDRNPIMRLEYDRDATSKPAAHVQIHAQRGALSHILSQAGHPAPHLMDRLHIPLGGHRFRPCLEDFLQFLIDECKLDAADGAHDAIGHGRILWRQIQTAVAVRDCPEHAVDALRELGYTVTEPPQGAAPARTASLSAW